METLLLCLGQFPEASEFKSYYVVWKLSYIYTPWMVLAVFKSYYVVWKQKMEYIIGEGTPRV